MGANYTSGSYDAAQNFNTAAVTGSVLEDFQQEVTDLLAAGWKVEGSIMYDGSDYVTILVQKKWN